MKSHDPTTSPAAKKAPGHPFAVAPAEELLYSLKRDGGRRWIDPILIKGRYYKIRKPLAYALIAIFLGLPLVPLGGHPALLVDVQRNHIYFFGGTFQPTDNLLLLAIGALIIITVFAITAIFGRLWCGYACPQTVYMEFVFRPIERWLEGKPTARRRRDAGPWVWDRLWRKGSKWTLYAGIALLLSFAFVSYFVGASPLASGLLLAPSQHLTSLGVVLGVAALVFLDFAYFRDQMCTIACPYGRLQTVLYDRDTWIVGYDARRGEPREKKRKGKDESRLGDCIDCGRCQTCCPTGMDIRRGLQMECIGCAQCIEVCDLVMAKTGKAPGLIRYTSERELETGDKRFVRPRVYVYGALMALSLTALLLLAFGRPVAGAEIFRSGREPYRELPSGEIANLLRLRLTNNLDRPQRFDVELRAPRGAILVVSRPNFEVAAGQVETLDLVVKLPDPLFTRGRVSGRFAIHSNADFAAEEDFVLLGPYR